MKKVLIISYYWPPSGGSGVQRWLKFAKYLPNNNWQPIIYTPENPNFGVKDEGLLKDISSDVIVWKQPIWEPYNLKERFFGKSIENQSAGIIANRRSFKNKFFNWVRGNFFIPDPKVFWVKPSIKYLQEKIVEEKINYIITTGPPHSMHLIGLGLKKAIPALKWIADFRDPWSELDILNEFHLSRFSKNKHKILERDVLKNADVALTVSETWVNDLQRLGASNVKLITNGYDSCDFNYKLKKTNKFIIGHYGLINHLRNPVNLWRVLDRLCGQNKSFGANLEIHLAGYIDSDILAQIQSFDSLKDKFKYLGYLTHDEVLAEYQNASILLLLLFDSQSGVGNYPGKLFEYFAAKKPILALGPHNSDVAQLIKRTNSGIYFQYDDTSIQDGILSLYNANFRFEYKGLDKFSRENLTKDLVDLLNQI